MHTIEIDGRPVAIMSGSRGKVEEFVTEPAFRDDMLTLEDRKGRALWNGRGEFTPLVRESFAEEVAAFERGFAKALADGDDPDRDSWLVLLIPVLDPTGDDDHLPTPHERARA